jgi:hypothetical protein
MRIRPTLVLLAAAALAVVGVGVPAPAFAASTGTIHVQALSPAGKPLHVDGLLFSAESVKGAPVDYLEGNYGDANGSLTFTGVPVGEKITVWGYANPLYLNTKKFSVTVADGATRSVSLTFIKGGAVSGTVTASGATPPYGTRVAVLTMAGKLVADYPLYNTASYSLTGLPTGTYIIQFNSRKSEGTLDQYLQAWSYWPHTTDVLKAKAIHVKQQGAHTAATVTRKISGAIGAGVTLSGSVAFGSGYGNRTMSVVASHAPDSFPYHLGSAGNGFSTPVNPGKYRIGIQGDYDPISGTTPTYWYVSDSKPPTQSESHAAWVTVGKSGKFVSFVSAKAQD